MYIYTCLYIHRCVCIYIYIYTYLDYMLYIWDGVDVRAQADGRSKHRIRGLRVVLFYSFYVLLSFLFILFVMFSYIYIYIYN